MFRFINNLFTPMNSEPENTFPLDPQDQTVNPDGSFGTPVLEINQVDGQDESEDLVPLMNDQINLISSVLREVVYLYTQTGAGISSELQERIRQAQELLEH
jgi:hypothetical protein